MKILHIIPSLNYFGPARQLALLCRGLVAKRLDTQICVLGKDATAIGHLGPGRAVHVLGQSRWLDLVALWKVRRLVRSFQPHIIHAWGPPAVRAVALAGRGQSRFLISNPLAADPLRTLDRWLLNRADRIVVRGQAEARRCRSAGLPGDRMEIIEPGIDQNFFAQTTAQHSALSTQHSALSTQHSPLVLCAGSLEPHKGYRDAIWALDIVRFLFPDIHLAVAGEGPDRERLEHFALRDRLLQRVSFLGQRADMAGLLNQASIIWVPSLADTGAQITLETMAAGKPVIAANVPSLREIIVDGRTGFLIPPGDKVALARRTRELLRNPDLAMRMGEAARRHALAFSADRFVERTTSLYQELAPSADLWRRSVRGEVQQLRVETTEVKEREAVLVEEATFETSEIFKNSESLARK